MYFLVYIDTLVSGHLICIRSLDLAALVPLRTINMPTSQVPINALAGLSAPSVRSMRL